MCLLVLDEVVDVEQVEQKVEVVQEVVQVLYWKLRSLQT
jgi:hypothetical protein